jgi:16S rRNA (uracil1498-N3)-methyltransferase
MNVRRFFWDGKNQDGTVILTGTEVLHISKVLRINVGQTIILCDGNCNDYLAVVEHIERNSVKLKLGKKILECNEPEIDVTLYLAYTKGDHLDFAVQKAVELGVGEIGLFDSERCVAAGNANKLERLNRIAYEAAKQSTRSRLVKVSEMGTLADVLLTANGLKLFCYELANEKIRSAITDMPEKVSVVCGPEGGFTENEVASAIKAGWKSVSLGKRILRAETAPLVALTVLMYRALEI